MRYFSYFGQSCLDVLGDGNPLVLVSMDGAVDDVPGSEKKVITGDTSIYKTVANEYGNMYDDVLEFEYTLIKFNDELITKEEQRKIETWLTSPKLSQYLQLFDATCDGDTLISSSTPQAIYCGTFIETSWIPCADGYVGVTFTFQCDSSYAWQFHDETRFATGTDDDVALYILTDDTQDYVYPRIKFTMRNDGEETIFHDVEFTFVNNTDNDSGFTMITQIDKTVVMDCRSCRITDNAGNLFSYDDIGWGDIGNVYWPRLVNGFNNFTVSTEENTTLEMNISYMSPMKIVGGWL